MFICAEATQHKERATIPRGFSWLLRRVQPIFPNPCQDLRFRCILLPPALLYEEWSNQAWKWVSSVCWWVKRDFQNNPISRGGFFLFYELHFWFFFASCAFQDSSGHDNYCRDTIFMNARTPFFSLLFLEARTNYCVARLQVQCRCVIIQSLDRSYFVKWNAELLHTRCGKLKWYM